MSDMGAPWGVVTVPMSAPKSRLTTSTSMPIFARSAAMAAPAGGPAALLSVYSWVEKPVLPASSMSACARSTS